MKKLIKRYFKILFICLIGALIISLLKTSEHNIKFALTALIVFISIINLIKDKEI